MKAFLILEDGTVFEGTQIGAKKEAVSEVVFNTSMTGYLEVLTDPFYAGQMVVLTYPLIGNYRGDAGSGVCSSGQTGGLIVREMEDMPSNFRCEGKLDDLLAEEGITGITGIDTRALPDFSRKKGTMNGMITTDVDYCMSDVIMKLILTRWKCCQRLPAKRVMC